MKRLNIIILFILTVLTVLGVSSVMDVSSSSSLEILQKDGDNVYHFWSSDPVMIPTTYTEKSEEFRGVWVATVWNLNMPRHTSETQYKEAFDDLIDEVVTANMNAIVFQVRPQNDAWHNSAYATYSKWLTGVEGGDPGWDVMQYMVDASHANGVEFHAWLNPYRVVNSSDDKATALATLHDDNWAKQNPDLVIAGNMDSSGRYPYILNPGEPVVKEYIRDVAEELYTMYDIDGIHFDDYFYPYSGLSSDTATYNLYKEVGETIEDFRRENVNDVVRGVKEDMDAYNLAFGTEVKFGISPFGLWGSAIEGYPKTLEGGSNTGPTNLSSYITQFADSKKWVEEGWVHYINPQVYWNFDHSSAPYADVVDWWASIARGTDVDVIIGHGIYNAHDQVWDEDEIADQLLYNQKHPEIIGSMMYSRSYLNISQMQYVYSNYWTTMPTNAWPTSNVDAPDITIDGTKVGSIYTSDVTVTLTAVDDVYFKIDDGDWTIYSIPLEFTSGSAVIYTKAVNGLSEESLVSSINVVIDKVNLDVPVISIAGDMIGSNYVVGSVVTITSNDPTIYVAINHGSAGEWVEYTSPIVLDEAGGYLIKTKNIDFEGYESAINEIIILTQNACFDDPSSIVTGTGTDPFYQNATVTLSSNSPVISYKINDGAWSTYTSPLVFDTEGEYTVYYKNDDECGNQFSETFTIDTTNPSDPTIDIVGSYDGKYYTEEITVELLTDDIDNTIMYRLHNGSTWSAWTEYTELLDIEFSATYTLEYYAIDLALNESDIQDSRIKVDIPPNENTLFVERDGQVVTYYGTSIPIELPLDYVEKDEEIRAVWIATVGNIDIAQHTSEADYKAKIIRMLDTIEDNNFNTVFFQVRPMNDAFYESSLAPYSRYLTGVEGGDPGWDVLGFMIEESHKRGIEFHAWLNPYRVSTGTDSKAAQLALLDDDNFAKQNPDLVIVDNAGKLILNPGEPQVQAYIQNVISELMTLYDVDGIHFDDYFYSYNGTNDSEDQEVYNETKEVGQALDDWRRENINTVVEGVYNLVEAYNLDNDTHVRFGISPFGIWMSGGTEGSNTATYALQSYQDQYADSKRWVEEGWVHYILPQLYWEFEHSAAPFADLVDWWADLTEANDVDLIIGHGFYRYDDDSWDNDNELLEQLRYISQYDSVIGSSFFSYRTLLSLDSEVVQAVDRLNNFYWTEYPAFPWESDIEKYVDPVCTVDQTLISGECVDNDPVCTVDQTLISGECIDIPICTDDQTLVNNACVDNEPDPDPDPGLTKKTGCFGSIGNNNMTLVVTSIIGGAALFFIRKFSYKI